LRILPFGCRFFSGAEIRLLRRLERVEAKGKARRLGMVGGDDDWVVATQLFFIFNPIFGDIIQFDDHIFQIG